MSKSKNPRRNSSYTDGFPKTEPVNPATRDGWNRREFISGVGRGVVGATVGASLLGAFAPFSAEAAEGSRFRAAVSSDGGVIACISAEASAVGIDILNRGGNAMDAAVACAFAVGVTRPDACGIGGDGFLVYRGHNDHVAALDFRVTAPAAVTPTTFIGPGFQNELDNCATPAGTGHSVVGVPGMLTGLAAALERYGSGRFTLAALIAPAESLARDGVVISDGLNASAQCSQNRLARFPETARIYSDIPARYRAGLKLRQVDYADSLKLIMDFGPEAFYQVREYPGGLLPRKSIAKLIVEDMQTTGLVYGGLMIDSDLNSYRAKWRTPLVSNYRDHRIIAMPPPTSGGIAAIEMLNLLEGFPLNTNTNVIQGALRDFRQSRADHLHVLAEAQKIAWTDRNRYVADPDFVYDFGQVPTKTLTSKQYAQQRRAEIDLDHAKPLKDIHPGPGHTTHLSVIDRKGNAVAVTLSLGAPFGSVVVAPGTGFPLNDQLTDFNMDTPGTANEPNGGKRPRSSQSPTIVVRQGKPVLAVGGAGGAAIIMGVVQAAINVVDFGLDIAHALDAERIDAAAWYEGSESGRPDNYLGMEDKRVTEAVKAALTSRGHQIESRRFDPRDAPCLDPNGCSDYHYVPHVQAAGFNLTTRRNEAVSDPRADFGSAGQ